MSYIQSGLNYRIVIFKLHLILVLSSLNVFLFAVHFIDDIVFRSSSSLLTRQEFSVIF